MEINRVSNSTVTRPTVSSNPEAVEGTANSTASATASVEKTTSGIGGYVSPFIRYDHDARVAVLLFRDSDTGETQDQIPSPRVLDEYRRAASRMSQFGGRSDGATGANRGTTPEAPSRGVSFASQITTSTAATAFGATSGPTVTAPSAAPTTAPAASGGTSQGGLVSMTI